MRKKLRKFILGACALVMTTTGLVACTQSVQVLAYEVKLSQELSYSFGAEFVIPDATITYNGEDITATKVALVYPNGVMVEGNRHLLQDEGTYKIVYYATVSGKTVSAEKSFEIIKDTTTNLKPTITLDPRFANAEQLKLAINESVEIPKATATDDNLKGDVKVTVYYNYGTALQQIVGIKNGVFTPTKVGEHAIVYSACDWYGEVAEEVVYVSCARVEGNEAVKLSAGDVAGNAGEEISIEECTLTGLYDDVSKVKVYARFEGETEREEICNYRYFPKNVGNYDIIYEYETPFKTYSTTSRLTTNAGGNVELNEAPLPKYYIKGARYTLEDWTGYEFNEKYPGKKTATAYMKADGGEYVEIDHKDVTIQANSSVQFKFVLGGKAVETVVFPVVDVGFGSTLSTKEYFQGEGFAENAENSLFMVKDGLGNYTLDFINVLSLSSFNLEFIVPYDEKQPELIYDEMQAIDVTLTDYYDRNKAVTVRYENNSGTLIISCNGGARKNTGKPFVGMKNTLFYNKGKLSDSSGTSWDWTGDFESNRLLLSVSFIGVDGDAGIKVQRIGSQGFDATSDRIEADIYYPDSQFGIHELGSVLTLQPAEVTDVLSPYLQKNQKFTVTAPNGSYVTSVDGVLLDGTCDVTRAYQIKIESVGSYLVQYTYEDQSGNVKSSYYGIDVPERNAPVITLDGVEDGAVLRAEINTWVDIAQYSVSDDTTAVEELHAYVAVFDPDYMYVTVENGRFGAIKAGDYIVQYYCYDAEGNCASMSYTVRVG